MDETDKSRRLGRILLQVQKPARYLGREWNAIKKDHDGVKVRMALAFPDLYEVGMSNLGLQVLYSVVNREPDMLLERVFAPAADMEELMRSHKLPLFALESGRPVKQFDFLGFSLQYELSFTNVLNMLDLAGIPLYSEQRKSGPLVIGGGPCAFNPEPLAPFFDLFLLGEAEEALPALLKRWIALQDGGLSRTALLAALSELHGIYVPALYRPAYSPAGEFRGLEPLSEQVPSRIRKNWVADLDCASIPTCPVMPDTAAIHDRAVLELFRGCRKACRFCQASAIYRPFRKRSPAVLKEAARELLRSTGYEELSLASLSTSDYPGIEKLVRELKEEASFEHLKLSLPSLRLDSFSVQLADAVRRKRRGSLTFAPEAGSERMRKIIRKEVSESDLFEAIGTAVEKGWHNFKLYFMIGLPFETGQDVLAIGDLCGRLAERFRKTARSPLSLSVSAAVFVSKAHTPFQWEPQMKLEEVLKRQRLLAGALKRVRGVNFSWHDPETSFLEAVFARGDRRLAAALEQAWREGCRFDGWSEYFSLERWQRAFQKSGLDPAAYAYRRYHYDDPLPWDHLDCGISREFLVREHRRAREEAEAVLAGVDEQ